MQFLFLKKKNIQIPESFRKVIESRKIKLIPVDSAFSLEKTELKKIKAVVVLGGDGTLLRAVPYAYKFDIPILGINMGNFGFLTETSLEEINEIFSAIEKEEYKVEERTLLSIHYKNNNLIALNEGAILKGPAGKIIYLNLKVEDEEVSTIFGDGVIISTPTGSTAYNVSAGGPIVHPSAPVFICTPICSFKINLKPLIIPDYFTIQITLHPKKEDVHLLIDGHINIFIKDSSPIIFKKAEKKLKLISSLKHTYFQILRNKFNL
jgi:NAD+ kinase